MGLITKEVTMIPGRKMRVYYLNLGYIFNDDNSVTVLISDLPKSNKALVDCECDYCNKIKTITYCAYNSAMKTIVHKYACPDCIQKKIFECNMYKYGVSNPNKLQSVKDKIIKTNIKKYGVPYSCQAEEVKEKIKDALIDKYGGYGMQSEILHEKAIETNMKKYGTSHPYKNPEMRDIINDKKQKTYMEHYGVDNPLKSKDIQEKVRNTNIKKYGYPVPAQSPTVLNKMKNTFIQKYGVDVPSKNKNIQQKISNTLYKNNTVSTSIQQKYICNLYNMKLNYPILYWNVDMYDIISDIICEYDGGGHNLCVTLGNMTQEEFNNKELVREKLIRQDNHKIIKIISKTDKLPSDTILLQMLSDAKQYFSDYPNHSWITFDIDEGIVRNAECKNGRSYFYGQLRRIKKSDLESA